MVSWKGGTHETSHKGFCVWAFPQKTFFSEQVVGGGGEGSGRKENTTNSGPVIPAAVKGMNDEVGRKF